jgi:hypothetical protein
MFAYYIQKSNDVLDYLNNLKKLKYLLDKIQEHKKILEECTNEFAMPNPDEFTTFEFNISSETKNEAYTQIEIELFEQQNNIILPAQLKQYLTTISKYIGEYLVELIPGNLSYYSTITDLTATYYGYKSELCVNIDTNNLNETIDYELFVKKNYATYGLIIKKFTNNDCHFIILNGQHKGLIFEDLNYTKKQMKKIHDSFCEYINYNTSKT